VSSAESAEVAFFGGPAVGGVDGVVEVLGDGWEPAGEEPAPGVAGVQEAAQVGVGPVPVHGEDRSGDRVGEHAFPGGGPAGEDAGGVGVDRLSAGEFSGLFHPDAEG